MTEERLRERSRRIVELGGVVSSALFAVALVGLLLPWIEEGYGTRSGLDFLFPTGLDGAAPVMTAVGLVGVVVALLLGLVRTRGAAIFRAVAAGVALVPFLPHLFWSWALGGDSRVLGVDTALIGAWVSFLALVAALVTNLVVARRMKRGRGAAVGHTRPAPG